ncbi:glycosyltransferase family 2 protein [Mucilaginibacter koreensis]
MTDINTYALLVPCYNAEAYIETFLQNLSALSVPFNEVLFYDDASTDHTAELLSSKGFKVIRGEVNRGPGYARNRLAEAATCSYIHFHDIDDEIVPDYISKVSAIANAGKYDVILCNVYWIDAVTRQPVLSWHYSNEQIQTLPLAYVIEHPIGGINGLYKRDVFLQAGGFDENYRIWEDADMHVRLAEHGARFCVIEEVLSVSLRYSHSGSTNQKQGWLNRLQLLLQYESRFNHPLVRKAIGREAQRTAGSFIMSKNDDAAACAMRLSERCSVPVPSSQNMAWRVLKAVLPPVLRINIRLLHLKLAFRKVRKSSNIASS